MCYRDWFVSFDEYYVELVFFVYIGGGGYYCSSDWYYICYFVMIVVGYILEGGVLGLCLYFGFVVCYEGFLELCFVCFDFVWEELFGFWGGLLDCVGCGGWWFGLCLFFYCGLLYGVLWVVVLGL